MPKKPPTGRVIRVIVDPDQQAALAQAANRANLPLATWVRIEALKAIHYAPEKAVKADA